MGHIWRCMFLTGQTQAAGCIICILIFLKNHKVNVFFTSLLPPSATFSLLQANTASFKTLLPKAADMWGCCVCDSQSKLMREWMLNRQHIDRQHRLRHIIWICNRSLDVTLAYERQEPSQTGLQPRGCLPSLTSHLTFVTVQTRVIYAVTSSMEVCNRRYVYNISFQCLHFVKEKYRGLRLCHWGATATTWSL